MTSRPPYLDPLAAIRQHLFDATLELFEAYGLPIAVRSSSEEPLPEANVRELVASSIGYTGENIRGSLLLLTTASVVSTWCAAIGADPTEDGLCDTVGEFNNMLLGRMKNRMLAHGVVLSIATPTTTIGTNMRVLSPSGGASFWQAFTGDGGVLNVRFDLTLDKDFVMPLEPAAPADAAAEGDLLLF